MALITLVIRGKMNVSLQAKDTGLNAAEDIIYFIRTTGSPNYEQVGEVHRLGECVEIVQQDTGSFRVVVDVGFQTQVQTPTQNDYIFFGKENKVGTSGLLGYYADVVMEYPSNVSNNPSELFAVSSEIVPSSK